MGLREIILKDSPGETVLLMGNESIARGAVEAGAKVATGYPGTPSSEIIETLALVAKDFGIRAMWCVNEKVAFEAAMGASFGGQRALVTMKAPGLNVAMDAVQSASYCGCNGGLVLIVADDPGPHTTQTEQDNRFVVAHMNLLPMLEPSDPQEAKEITVRAFDISEKLQLPIVVRTTTRVNHTTGNVVLGSIQRIERPMRFVRDAPRYIRASMAWNRERHRWLNRQMEVATNLLEGLPFNKLEMKGNETVGVIATGVSYNYVKELVRKNRLSEVAILKVGVTNPLPKSMFRKLLQVIDKVLVVEELEPYIELHVKIVLTELKKDVQVLGKLDGTLPREGEYNADLVAMALSKLVGKSLASYAPQKELLSQIESIIPRRPPPMCAGCSHRAAYYAIKKAIRKLGYKTEDIPIIGDIGCYALSLQPPLEAIWIEHCMGASISIAAGLKYGGFDKPVVATIGDSTFYHAGLPALLDSVYNGAKNLCVVILDNGVTAMTGHQPCPSTGRTAADEEVRIIPPEEIARAMGVEFIRVTDAYESQKTIEILKEALEYPGVSCVIIRRLCVIEARRRGTDFLLFYEVDPEKCNGCKICISQFCCLAMRWDENRKKAEIDPLVCSGCSVCAQICPTDAIIR